MAMEEIIHPAPALGLTAFLRRVGGAAAGRWLVLGAWLVLAMVAVCALAPDLLAPFSPTEMRTAQILTQPGAEHLLGTDQFGRDVLSLIIHGARRSVLIALASVLLGGVAGVLLGVVAGYVDRLDGPIMRVIDAWMAIPGMLLAILIATALGPSLFHLVLAISAVMTPRYARVMRGQVLAVRRRPFVDAARSIGAGHLWIVSRHLLPHCAPPMLVMLTLGIGHSILMGSALGFLGFGGLEERPDWGYLLTQGRSYLGAAWWISTFAGLAITVVVVAVNLLTDDVRRRLQDRPL
jgi:peptide/nickel transport system permease protein